MAIGIERVHIAPVVKQRSNGGGMNVGYVIDLGIRLHRDLPVAVEVEAVSR